MKPQQLLKRDFDEKRGFSVIIPSKDEVWDSRESEEVKRTSKDSGSTGYQCGDTNLTERFNVNNVELNKKRFMEQHQHILKNK